MTSPAQSAKALASGLAAQLAGLETPEPVLQRRLSIAADVAVEAARAEAICAALVVGSTALRRCSPRADLDVVLICGEADPAPRFEARRMDGLQVELERITRAEALAMTADDGWTWELRTAARLGCGLPVHDPDGFGARLRDRAAGQRPWAEPYEETLRGVYGSLAALGDDAVDDGTEALRGCLDNLALLALLDHPRRYQKAKWVLADLLHAGEAPLVEATLRAYGVVADNAVAANDVLAAVRGLLDGVYEALGAPSHETLIAMGYAPQHPSTSYISRGLADAEDLAASGRFLEAQYVAKFCARLLGGLCAPPDAVLGLPEAITLCGEHLADRYRGLFGAPGPASTDLLQIAWASAEARRESLAARASEPVEAAAPA